jgi:glucose-6-phosphate 1-dehydrogenase
MMNKVPGLGRDGMKLQEVSLDLSMSDEVRLRRRRIAYERLLLDVMNANSTLFVRRDETEAAWKWVDQIAEGWRELGQKPKPYAAGSWGPSASVALTERYGHSWHD